MEICHRAVMRDTSSFCDYIMIWLHVACHWLNEGDELKSGNVTLVCLTLSKMVQYDTYIPSPRDMFDIVLGATS